MPKSIMHLELFQTLSCYKNDISTSRTISATVMSKIKVHLKV